MEDREATVITGETRRDAGTGQDFLKGASAAQETTPRVGKWNYVKLISFWTAKEAIDRVNSLQNGGNSHQLNFKYGINV